MSNKLDEQKKILIDLRKQFEDDSAPDGQVWTELELQQLLKNLPLAIFKQGNNVTAAFMSYKMAKQKLKKEFNVKILEANYDPDLKSATERKAWAENSKEYLDAEEELIIAEGNYKAADLHYTAYENLYTAVKKATAFVVDQNKIQSRNN